MTEFAICVVWVVGFTSLAIAMYRAQRRNGGWTERPADPDRRWWG